MAEKRMFSGLVLNSDDFMDMPAETQMLYIRVCMSADDRGICDCPRTVMRSCGASNASMKMLLEKKFLILPRCNQSVTVVKHWWMHNNVRKERFKETKYTDVVSELYYDDNKSYSQNPNDGHIPCVRDGKLIWPPDIPDYIALPLGTQRVPSGYPTDTQRVPQIRLEENSIDKFSIDKNNTEEGCGEEPEPTVPQPTEAKLTFSDSDIDELKRKIKWAKENNLDYLIRLYETEAKNKGIDVALIKEE